MTTRRIFDKRTLWFAIGSLLGITALLAACGTASTAAPCPEVECPECPQVTYLEQTPYEDIWAASAHADEKSKAFTHWDEEDPPEIPIECAKCHSRPGFLDFLGVDGTNAGTVENAVPVGTTITCFACHNEVLTIMDSVVYPSGARIARLGAEARCIPCHQGQASGATVDDAIAEAGITDADTPGEELEFVDSHNASGATPFGAQVQVAYEYDGKTYRGRFTRGGDFLSCIQCHDNHSLELEFETCQECHTSAKEEAKEIRVDSTDYDGDGDIEEGIIGEIETIHEALYTAIQVYASGVAGTPIVHDSNTYPYFFIDTDGNGEAGPGEAIYPNKYNAWTPRLLRAAYNYQFALNDPGAFAHNSDYVIQALYDSLSDVGGGTFGMMRPGDTNE